MNNDKKKKHLLLFIVAVSTLGIIFCGLFYLSTVGGLTSLSRGYSQRTIQDAITLSSFSSPQPTAIVTAYPSSSPYSYPSPTPYPTSSPTFTTQPTSQPSATPHPTFTPNPTYTITPYPYSSPSASAQPSTQPVPHPSNSPAATHSSPTPNTVLTPKPLSSPDEVGTSSPLPKTNLTTSSSFATYLKQTTRIIQAEVTQKTAKGILFSGYVLPNSPVNFRIHSTDVIVVRVTSDKRGLWSYLVTYPLEPGDHTLTVTSPDTSGNPVSLIKKFFVSPVQAASSLNGAAPAPLDPLSLIPTSYILIFAALLLGACSATVCIYRRQIREDMSNSDLIR